MKHLNARGMTLIGVLIAVGIMGILSAVLVTIFGNMSSMANRGKAEAEAQIMVHQIQNLVANRACDQVIRGAAGGVTWDWKDNVACADSAGVPYSAQITTCADVDHLEIPAQGARPATTLIFAAKGVNPGSRLATNLEVDKIYLRQPIFTLGESQPSVSSLFSNGSTYDTTTAKLVIRFKSLNTGATSILGGRTLPEYTVDLTVATDQATHQIKFCAPAQKVQALSKVCDPTCSTGCTYDYCLGYCVTPGTTNACGAITTPAPAMGNCVSGYIGGNNPCYQFFYLSGFDSTGQPICNCKLACAYSNVPHMDYCQ